MEILSQHSELQDKVSNPRYTRLAIWLHWLIAAGIFINLFLGFTMDSLFANTRGQVIAIHASVGLSVLALAMLRLFWRLTNRPPELPSAFPSWERHAATAGHFLLYVGMILLPLSGWAILSTNPPANSSGAAAAKSLGVEAHPNDGIEVWGVIKVPVIGPINELGRTPEGVRPQKKLHGSLESLHEMGALLLLALIAVHVLAALRHQAFGRISILARMGLPERRSAVPRNPV